MAFKSLAANDIFISYARRDATTYATGLADELTKKNFSCFTDRLGTDAGERLPPDLLKELKNCGMLVLLCTEAAKESIFVGQELKEYIEAKGTTRTIVPVIFDQAAIKAGWYSMIAGKAPEFEDPQRLVTGDPSQAVISRIEKSFNYSRSKERLRKYTIGAGVLLAVLLLLSGAASVFAGIQLKAANTARDEAVKQTRIADEKTNLANTASATARDAEQKRQDAERATVKAREQQSVAEQEAKSAQQQAQVARSEAKKQQQEAVRQQQIAKSAQQQAAAAKLEAAKQTKIAEDRGQEATSQILSSNSLSALQTDPELSLLLATKAAERPNSQSETALKRALIESHIRAALRGHTDTIYDAEFSPDGKLLATASKDGTARVWDVSTGQLLKEFKETSGTSFQDGPPAVRVATFSHDGKSLLLTGADGVARLRETLTWQLVSSFRVGNRQVNDATFSPDDKQILTGSGSSVRVWDAGTKQMLKEVGGFSSGIDDLSFSANGKSIVVSEGKGVSVIDSATWQQVAQFKEPQPAEECGGALSPDGKLVVVTGSATPWVWEVGTKKKITELHGHTEPVQRAKFSADGHFVLTVSEDSTARVWDTEQWQSVLVLRGHTGMLFSAAFSPDGSSVVTGGEDKIPRIWNISIDELQRTFRGNTGMVRRAEFSPDGQFVLTAGDDHTAQVWKVSTGQSTELKGHTDQISAARFSRDGNMIVSASNDTTARIWESKTGRSLTELRGHIGPLSAAEFSPDGKLVVTASDDKSARIWDLGTGRLMAELKHDHEVKKVEFSPDGKLIVTVDEVSGWLWDAHTYQKITELVMPQRPGVMIEGGMNVAKFSPDGSRIAGGTQVGRVGVWDSSGKFLFDLRGSDQEAHTQYITGIAFSKDGKLIVTTSADQSGGVWNASNGKNLVRLRGPKGEFWNADFSPDGRFVVTANQDNSAWVWTTQSGQVVTQLKGSTGALRVARFSPDGKYILTAGLDKRAYLFMCEVCDTRERLLDLARTRVTRNLTPDEEKVYSR